MSRKINPGQLKKLHTLLSMLDLMDEKKTLVSRYSGAGHTSSRDLLYHEAQALIEHLDEQVPNDDREAKQRMIRKMLHYGHLLKWDEPTSADRRLGLSSKKVNFINVDGFCKSDKCSIRKPMDSMNTKELSQALTQLEQLYKHTVKRI